jgi:hypothetical protein
VDRVAAVATRVDPRLILKDFQQYAGKPVAVTATIVGLEVVTVPGGGTATYLQLEPVGNKDPANLELLALYKGTAPVLKGDTADCYLLPSDLVAYHSKKGDGKAILCIAMFLNPVRTP